MAYEIMLGYMRMKVIGINSRRRNLSYWPTSPMATMMVLERGALAVVVVMRVLPFGHVVLLVFHSCCKTEH